MTPEQQRIKIAEACGWKRIPADDVGSAAKLFYGDVWWRDAENNTIASAEQLPDYTEDLNAMHEAEKTLREMQTMAFIDRLGEIVNQGQSDGSYGGIWNMLFSTAAQRAEAFLKTINLWEP
jgi:hypothetical protein